MSVANAKMSLQRGGLAKSGVFRLSQFPYSLTEQSSEGKNAVSGRIYGTKLEDC